MKIEVQIWDSKNSRFHRETINDEDLSNITKQKILSWYDSDEQSLKDFEILNININS